MKDSPTPAATLVTRPGLLVIAHRGASTEAPENTLPAFRLAVTQGADLVELDTRESRDGVPVVFHDETLDRTTDAIVRWGGSKIPLAAHTRADLETLDAGVWFQPRFEGTRVPTLAAALEVIQNGAVTLIERKAGQAETLLALLKKKGLLGRVVVQSFDWVFLQDCHRKAPSLVLGALGSKELTAKRLAEVLATGAAVLGWKQRHITPALVAMAHAEGLKVWAWTVDDPTRARELVAMGVDGLITNGPARLRAALR